MKYCTKCGAEMADEAKFCSACGYSVEGSRSVTERDSYHWSSYAVGGRTSASYFFAFVGAVIALIVRLTQQETWYYLDTIWDNTKLLGLDRDMKPTYSLIPVITLMLVFFLIASDKVSGFHTRLRAFFINAIFIILAFLFIWLDIPSNIVSV